MNKAAYIEALSRASDRSGHLLVALMDKYHAANLQEITEAQAVSPRGGEERRSVMSLNHDMHPSDFERGYDRGYADGKRDAAVWVSVKDRLPEDGTYLVWNANRPYYGARIAFFSTVGGLELEGRENVFSICDAEWGDIEIEVTHWMPLPEPPKEDAE